MGKIVDSPQIVKFLGGERYRPKQDAGAAQIALQRVAVNWATDGCTPKSLAAFLKVDLGIVPGAQQSPGNIELAPGRNNRRDQGVFYHIKLAS